MNELSTDEALELLGAFILNACDDREAELVVAALASYPALAEEADRLAEAASLLGLLVSVNPPAGVWAAVSARLVPVALLAEANTLFEAAVTQLGVGDWSMALAGDWFRHDLSGWTAHELVAHLSAGHDLLTARLGGDGAPADLVDVIAAASVDALNAEPDALLAAWRRSTEHLLLATRQCSAGSVGWLGSDVPPTMAILERAFETWIHANDLRRLSGHPEAHPAPENVHLLCDLAITLWPVTLEAAGHGRDGSLRVVLEGPGGGHWTMPLTPGGDPSPVLGTLIAESLDLCALMGDRLHPERFEFRLEGPEELTELIGQLANSAGLLAHR